MVRRECPGCTCGIESSLAMKHVVSGAFFELSRLKNHGNSNHRTISIQPAPVEKTSQILDAEGKVA
jgi:hypothetical protein